MLRFRCDCCGKKIPKVTEVVQFRLTPYAYVPEADPEFKIPLIGELCKDCSEEFEDFFMARQEELAKNEHNVADSPWINPIRIHCKLGFEDGETVVIGGDTNSPGNLLPKSDSEKKIKPKNPCGEGRCITLARIRAAMSQSELAERCYIGQGTISNWERGLGGADWEALERALPELAEIHQVGCAAVCEYGAVCSQEEGCRYKGFRMGYGG